jgi:hypothetical protein
MLLLGEADSFSFSNAVEQFFVEHSSSSSLELLERL